ncbi:MAG: TetR/AcrR family transcriptional regulator C-terminal domain-containing protein [Candidatus Dormibacteria bacterium]
MTEQLPTAVEADRHTLTRRRILDTALALVDAEGLEALSMRRLGAALGVEAMSIYHHVPGKAALLDGLVATVLGQLPLPDATPVGWEDAVRRGFSDFRRLLLVHPALFTAIATRPPTERESLVPVARAFAILEVAGFRRQDAATAWDTLLAYTFGFVLCEISGVGEATRGAAMLSLLEEQSGPDFASLRAAHLVADDWDGDVEFARGLEVVITGLRAYLAGTRT